MESSSREIRRDESRLRTDARSKEAWPIGWSKADGPVLIVARPFARWMPVCHIKDLAMINDDASLTLLHRTWIVYDESVSVGQAT